MKTITEMVNIFLQLFYVFGACLSGYLFIKRKRKLEAISTLVLIIQLIFIIISNQNYI